MIGNKAIKALECCSNIDAKCDECVFYGNEWCRVTLAKESLRIINRLKAENKNCGVKIQNQREQLKACNEKIKRLEVDNDKLRRLEFQVVALNEAYEESVKEAIKEFWDELKRRSTLNPLIVSTITGDNLLKEMGCGE